MLIHSNDQHTRATLRGINTLAVIIEDINADGVGGLTTDRLITDVKLWLRKAGIRVTDENKTSRGTPFLYVHVNPIKDGLRYAYSLIVQFNQNARLERNGEHVVGVTTWSTGGVGASDASEFQQGVRALVADAVDIFINAFRTVNPRS